MVVRLYEAEATAKVNRLRAIQVTFLVCAWRYWRPSAVSNLVWIRLASPRSTLLDTNFPSATR